MIDNRANDPSYTDETPSNGSNDQSRASSVPMAIPEDMCLKEDARMPLTYKPLLKRSGNCRDYETTISDPSGEREGNKYYARYDPQGEYLAEKEIFGDSRDLTNFPEDSIRQQLDRFRQRQ